MQQAEFRELAASANLHEIAVLTVARHKPDPKYFIGSGKAEEIRHLVSSKNVEVVIFDHDLSPAQARNLEELFKCRVLSRTDLILDIFAQRARTFEGKLQVELAQLQHLSTRLIRGWTHLERQRGGIGLRGPGETQLETDRRLLSERIKTINKRLLKVHSQRDLSRRARKRAFIPTVSFVGYTNAGKSTLFNRLTSEKVFTADQLFATLDPTLRQIHLPDIGKVIVADTVGFIRKLPHNLVDAFSATLEETQQAALLIHIIDAASPDRKALIAAVEQVLTEIDANHVPTLQVYNKIDLVRGHKPRIDRNDKGQPIRVWLSALTGQGLDLLYQALNELLAEDLITMELELSAEQGRLLSQLYAMGAVRWEEPLETGGWRLEIRLPKREYDRLRLQ